MSFTFAHPAHPAQQPASSSGLLTVHATDPHQPPNFDSEPSHTPLLYLPPLLSSLPEHLQSPTQDLSSESAPRVTRTRLPDIDPASLSLHKALHGFRPLDNNYAATPYSEAFNWRELRLPEDEEREWYCVVFRSKRKAGSDGTPLYDADRQAHEEAVTNGGLIMYWYGIPDQKTGMNLATCIWQSRRHATAANTGPHHIRAMKLAADSYEVYNLERHVLRKVKGEAGITVEAFGGGDVGW